MIKFIIEFLLVITLKIALWFRYKIVVKGLDQLNEKNLKNPGGILFLPNHPTVFVDATSITIALWPKIHLRPMIVEYMYYLPIVSWVMKLLNGLPIPNFSTASNSLKRKKAEKVIEEVCKGLKKKDNFLIFPAGRTKSTAYEAVEGASAVHRIVQSTPEANIVLVRVKGLWGSSFSRALTGKAPPMFATMFQGAKHVLKNLLFFTPRRTVTIEFTLAPADFPYQSDKNEFNKYLEHFYNQPDGLKPHTVPYPGDSLMLISYSRWKEELPTLWQRKEAYEDQDHEIAKISPEIQQKVIKKIAELSETKPELIKPQMSLTADLGMDSLDIAEMTAFLHDEFDIQRVSVQALTSVGKVMSIAAEKVAAEEIEEEEEADTSPWRGPSSKERVQMPSGETISEVFLNACQRMGNGVACGDMRAGVVTFAQLKQRVIILAEYIKQLPGEYVGILLPASTAATMTILACQLAGKTPVMVNWTVGPRHLQAILELTNVQAVLSSWAFLDRLQNVEFNGLEDRMVMLEDVRLNISLKDKLRGYLRSKLGTKSILKTFGIENRRKESTAVLLFTSGTESMPKGVPLSHHNILSNQREALSAISLYSDDVIFGILPPFHSFGFTVSSLIGALAGVRTAFSPDPTDGKALAKAFEKWKATIALGAPTFIKGMIKAANPQQLKTMRLCITGAEKMPPDLELMLKQLGKEESLMEGYGITECSPILTFTEIGPNRKGVGRPLPGVEICVVHLESYQPVGVGEQGMILASGPNVFSGYLNPGLTSPFVSLKGQKWYVSGDLGYLDEAGNLTLSGRLKRFIKLGGEMVSLAALEEALGQAALRKGWSSPSETPALAVCAKEPAGEKAKFYLFTQFAVSLDDVNRALREAGFSNLVKFSEIKQVVEIPLMGTGKVNYRKLEEGIN